MFRDRLHLGEGSSSTPSARIMCPGLMVRVMIRQLQDWLRALTGRMQLTHVTSDTHNAYGRAG
jgi:hypothetical protein